MVSTEDAVELVLSAVEQLAAGEVATYGDIAWAVGASPRQVGAVMSSYGASVAWWRVVNHRGTLPPHLRTPALAHWRSEGFTLKTPSTVNLSAHRIDRKTLAARLADS